MRFLVAKAMTFVSDVKKYNMSSLMLTLVVSNENRFHVYINSSTGAPLIKRHPVAKVARVLPDKAVFVPVPPCRLDKRAKTRALL
jgi:hypothetical protein